MDASHVTQLGKLLDERITSFSSVSGGDICKAYCCKTSSKKYFVKYLNHPSSFDLLGKEARGLELIKQSKTLRVPKVCELVVLDENETILVLEYLEEDKNISKSQFDDFGQALAQMHQNTNTHYGLDYDNYIGMLEQKNTQHSDFSSFYWNCRLLPQLKLARDKGLIEGTEIPLFEKLQKELVNIIPKEEPALIHGDLWSGNYMFSGGEGYLFDVSVSYNHREMDLAMMDLFGGFDQRILESYQNQWPLSLGFNKRKDIYQLYYLIAHLNIFGRSYKDSVDAIVNRYN